MIDAFTPALEVAARIRNREVSVVEVVRAQLERIEALNPAVNAVVTLDARALEAAASADAALARGDDVGPLHGVPFTLKDSHETRGLRTTVGFPALADHVPDTDGTVAARLRAAGAVLLGKTNVPPLLLSAQTVNPIFGRTSNPHDLTRTAGGSSGGSAAAVAAGLACFDVGSDLSGSIRIPSAFCGVFGLKPTVGRIPVTGQIPPLPGMPRPDRIQGTAGPIARSAADLGALMRVLSGPDGVDLEVPPVPFRDVPRISVRGLRVAYRRRFDGVPTSAAVVDATDRALGLLERAGAMLDERAPGFSPEELDAVWRDHFRAFGSVIMDLAKGMTLPLIPKDGPQATAADVVRILERRDALIRRLEAEFETADVFLCPAAICTAFPHSPPGSPIVIDGEVVESRFIDHYLYPFSLTGSPAMVVPAGAAQDRLPVAVQLVGKRWHDERLLGIGAAIAEVLDGYVRPVLDPYAGASGGASLRAAAADVSSVR